MRVGQGEPHPHFMYVFQGFCVSRQYGRFNENLLSPLFNLKTPLSLCSRSIWHSPCGMFYVLKSLLIPKLKFIFGMINR
jgi:hypothetical protein